MSPRHSFARRYHFCLFIIPLTVCPRSSDPFRIVTYYIKWGTTSWTHIIEMHIKLKHWHIFFIFPIIKKYFLLFRYKPTLLELIKAFVISSKKNKTIQTLGTPCIRAVNARDGTPLWYYKGVPENTRKESILAHRANFGPL